MDVYFPVQQLMVAKTMRTVLCNQAILSDTYGVGYLHCERLYLLCSSNISSKQTLEVT